MINQFASAGINTKKCLHLKHLITDYGKAVVLVRYRWLYRFRSGNLTPDTDQCGGYRSLSDMDADSTKVSQALSDSESAG